MSTQETQHLVCAAAGVGEMDPKTAWDLDAQLAGLSKAALALAEAIGQYVETLNNIRTDPRVTAQTASSITHCADLVGTFSTARNTFRTLYAPQFEAAENGVRNIRKAGFWDESNTEAA